VSAINGEFPKITTTSVRPKMPALHRLWLLKCVLGMGSVLVLVFALKCLPFVPGVWLSRANHDSLLALAFAISVFSVAFFVLMLLRVLEGWAAILIGAAYFSLMFIPLPTEFLMKQWFGVEKQSYRTALSTNTPYQKQYQTWNDGRILIYWQWVQSKQADAIGLIFDTQDRFDQAVDRGTFSKACVGPDFVAERIEKHSFMVLHRQKPNYRPSPVVSR